jgi:hypothetical protein
MTQPKRDSEITWARTVEGKKLSWMEKLESLADTRE